jgi:hypothetical protein
MPREAEKSGESQYFTAYSIQLVTDAFMFQINGRTNGVQNHGENFIFITTS